MHGSYKQNLVVALEHDQCPTAAYKRSPFFECLPSQEERKEVTSDNVVCYTGGKLQCEEMIAISTATSHCKSILNPPSW